MIMVFTPYKWKFSWLSGDPRYFSVSTASELVIIISGQLAKYIFMFTSGLHLWDNVDILMMFFALIEIFASPSVGSGSPQPTLAGKIFSRDTMIVCSIPYTMEKAMMHCNIFHFNSMHCSILQRFSISISTSQTFDFHFWIHFYARSEIIINICQDFCENIPTKLTLYWSKNLVKILLIPLGMYFLKHLPECCCSPEWSS